MRKTMKVMIATAVAAMAASVGFAGDSAPFLLDTADGTRIAAEGEAIPVAYSPRWGNAASCTVAESGRAALVAAATEEGTAAWTPSGTGGHTLSHTAGAAVYTAQFAVLGDDVGLHGGVLAAGETWAADKVHLITAPLTVPSGVSLTIEPGAVVKFMPGTSLTVAGGGICTAKGVIFTHVNDDTIGGDVLFDGASAVARTGDYTITGNITDDDTTEYRYMPPQTLTSSVSSDTQLKGYRTYIVSNSVTVASGATLTLQPGTILKFNTGCSLTVNGTLDAQGTRAAPIVFTSLKDDAHGGDANGDGEKTYAQAGDWHQITGSGTVKLNYCEVLWCSAQNNQGALYPNGGTWQFDNSIVAHCEYDCMRSYGGTFTANNSVFMDASMGAAPSSGTARFNNCVFSYLTTAVRWGNGTFYNCVFSDISQDIIDTKFYSSTLSSRFYNCCFWNPKSTGDHATAKVGQNGCFYADPLFADPDNGDFRIAANSPCVDAGDGAVAPATDYWGRPRMDVQRVADTGRPDTDGVCPDIGIYEVDGHAAVPPADLAVLHVGVSAGAQSSFAPGDTLTVSYVVTNLGASVSKTWRDTVAFSNAYGTVVHGAVVETAASLPTNGPAVTVEHAVAVPPLAEGEWHVLVNANAYRDVFEQSGEDNNGGASANAVSVAIPASPLSGTTGGTVGKGTTLVRKFTAPEGQGYALEISVPAGASVAYGVGGLPSSGGAAFAASAGSDGIARVSIPAGATVYVEVSGETQGEVSMRPFAAGLTVRSVTPATLPQSGEVTLSVAGLHLGDVSAVHLVSGGRRVAAGAVRVESAESLTAKFDCSRLASGTAYDLVVTADAATASLPGTVTVSGVKGEAKLYAKLDMPSSLRQGRSFVFYIDYANEGNVDMPAPVFTVKSEQMVFTTDYGAYTNSVKVIGLGAEGSAGVLKPGESFRMPVKAQVKADIASRTSVSYTLSSAWVGGANAGKKLQLESLLSEEWVYDNYTDGEGMYGKLAERLGATWGEFYQNLGSFLTAAAIHGETIPFDLASEYFAVSVMASISAETGEKTVVQSAAHVIDTTSVRHPVGDGNSSLPPIRSTVAFANAGTAETAGAPLTIGPDTSKPWHGDNSDPGDVWVYKNEWWYRPGSDEFSGKNNIVILVHGLNDSIHGDWAIGGGNGMAPAFAAKGKTVLCIDHGDHQHGIFSQNTGPWTAGHIPEDAKIAYENLKKYGVTSGSQIEMLVGHSHGGHFAGHVAEHYNKANSAAKVKRLIGLDTSPLYTHPCNLPDVFGEEAASRRFPNAWRANSADSVEFYKSSWWYSQGSVGRTRILTGFPVKEVYGLPSFFLVEDKAGSFKGDNAFIASYHHGYSRTWLTSRVLANDEKVLAGGKDCNTRYKEYSGLDTYEPNTFGGVIRGGRMECGKALRDELNFDSSQWRLAEAFGHPKTMQELRNRMFLLTEYHLDGFSFSTDKLVQGDKVTVTLDGYNAADNISTAYDYWDPFKGLVRPWNLARGSGWLEALGAIPIGIRKVANIFDTGIGNQVWAVELGNDETVAAKYATATRLKEEEATKLMEGRNIWPLFDTRDGTGKEFFSHPTRENANASARTTNKFKPVEVKLNIKFNGREAGMVKKGEAKPDGEKVLFIAVAGALRNHVGLGRDKQLSFYPFDLCWDDDCIAVVKTVYAGPAALANNGTSSVSEYSANKGTAAASVDMPKKTAANAAPVTKGASYTITDDNTYEADEYGNWEMKLTGIESFSTTDIVSGRWEGRDCSVSSSGWNSNPNVTVNGTLPLGTDGEPVPAKDYTVTLTVKDAAGKTNSVSHVFTIHRKTDDDPGDSNGGGSSDVPQSCDPNAVSGPEGVGPERYVQPGEWMSYTIFFENKTNALAAAQFVTVDNPLSEWLDWSTFEMGDVGFGAQVDTGLAGLRNGTSEVTMEGTNLSVRTELTLDAETGVASWLLRIVSPYGDSDGWPYADDPTGFLPPNDPETHCGEGHLTYRVRVRDDAPPNVKIVNSATIVFDYNDPIETDPSWTNTVANVRKVELDLDGVPVALDLIAGLPFGEIPDPAPRRGYVFEGWFTRPEGRGMRVTPTAVVPEDLDGLYAYWTKAGPSLPWTAAKAKVLDGAVYDADGNVAGVIQLKVAKPNAKKRTTKVSGSLTLLDGKKRSIKAATANVPADLPFKATLSVKGLGSLSLEIGDDGFAGTVGAYSVATAKVGGKWTRTDAKVHADATSASLPSGALESLLPLDVPVRAKGGKWAFDKAASVKLKKGALTVDTAKGRTNLSGLKLTYTPKTGLFKGSFKLYAIQGGKLKKFTVKVTGVVVDGTGTGVAKLAKPAATWNVAVE